MAYLSYFNIFILDKLTIMEYTGVVTVKIVTPSQEGCTLKTNLVNLKSRNVVGEEVSHIP